MRTNILRSLAVLIFTFGALVGGLASHVQAQAIGQPIAAVPPFTLDFDEAGNSLLNGGPNPNQVVLVAGGGIQYYLPGIVQPGQILVTTPVDIDTSNPNGESDLLTFFNGPDINGALTGILLFESLFDPFDPLLAADVPKLNYLVPIQSILEVGPEGNNGFTYIVPGAVYNGISDGLLVPEPSTFVLGGCGLVGLIALAYRRRATRARGSAVTAPTASEVSQVAAASNTGICCFSQASLPGRMVTHVVRSIRRAVRWSFASRSNRRVALGGAMLGLALLHATNLPAAQVLQYLQVPASGAFSSPTTFNLPNYGNVQVSIAGTSATFFDQVNGYNQSAGPYTWGTDTQRLGVLNTSGAVQNYSLNFAFLNGAPVASDLVLVVVGLASGTTATASQAGSLVGEYTFPQSGFYPAGPSSTTVLTGSTFSSLNDRDPLNTGWALYQPTGTFTNLSLSVSQINGDGIGFTLGYQVPEPSSIVLMSVGMVALTVTVASKKFKRVR